MYYSYFNPRFRHDRTHAIHVPSVERRQRQDGGGDRESVAKRHHQQNDGKKRELDGSSPIRHCRHEDGGAQ